MPCGGSWCARGRHRRATSTPKRATPNARYGQHDRREDADAQAGEQQPHLGHESPLGPEVTEERVDDRPGRTERDGGVCRGASRRARAPGAAGLGPAAAGTGAGTVGLLGAGADRGVAVRVGGPVSVGASVGRSTAYGGVGAGVRGRTARIRAPRSPTGGVTAAMDPPCSSQTQLAMASPMPVPPPASSPEPKRSKTCCGVLGRDAAALVGDREPPAVRTVRAGAHGHAPARRAVPVGVVEQVGEDLRETGRVRGDVQVGRDVDDVDGAAPATTPASATARSTRARTSTAARARGARPPSTRLRSSRSPTRVAEPLGLGQRGRAARRRRDARRRRRGSRAGPAGRRAGCAARGRRSPRAGGAAGRRRRGRPPSC